ncbi:hypothetical protein E2C01_022164 [Portunus trituberculatus]|uniref:Uncharacterized protein n=1 Tax=Portunus trituberculatus TaxID=210409 RepID=A0A5B7E599_PORTR|nr:hypothetical protein [Portunus trituberculatus]
MVCIAAPRVCQEMGGEGGGEAVGRQVAHAVPALPASQAPPRTQVTAAIPLKLAEVGEEEEGKHR